MHGNRCEDICACLLEAGCSEKEAEQVRDALQEGRKQAAVDMIEEKREILRKTYHNCCKKIDCLDYLSFCIRNDKLK